MIHHRFTCLPFSPTGCLTFLHSVGFDLKYCNLWVEKSIKYFNISTDFFNKNTLFNLSNFIDFFCVILLPLFADYLYF